MVGYATLTYPTPSLPHRDREPAQIGVRHQPHLLPRQLQHSALLVGQHDRACPRTDREPCARRAVDAGDVGGVVDVADAAPQDGLGAAEDEAVVEPAGRERVGVAAEMQHTMATGTADDPSRLVDD